MDGARPKFDERFFSTDEGIFFRDPDPEKPPLLLCGPLQIVAETRDANGGAWGKLLRWRDRDGRQHEWAMPRETLAGDGAEVRRQLLAGGLFVSPARKAREKLLEYLAAAYGDEAIRCVGRIGWHDDIFVLPDAVFGDAKGEQVVWQSAGTNDHAFRVSGALEEWRENLAKFASGNSRLIFGFGVAFAAPLAGLIGTDGGGFNLRGPSSCGKTTALRVAASAWGGGGLRGYAGTWRATSNGLEGVAAGHCDVLLCLDELGQIDSDEASNVAYMLASGVGKARAHRDGAARAPLEWRTLFLSTGEIGIADKVAEGGRRRAAAGQQVRVVDVPADAGKGLGLFEDLHGFASADAFARHLGAMADAYYGTAARAFLETLTTQIEDAKAAIKEYQAEFIARFCPRNADGQVHRVAARFALAAAGGELAAAYGVLPFASGEAMAGVGRCFRAWLAERGGIAPAEVLAGLDRLRAFIEAHGATRFVPRVNPTEIEMRSVNRAGFREQDDAGRWRYFILKETWKNEICKGVHPTALAAALIERGFLIPDRSDGKTQSRHRLPGLGVSRCYQISGAILDDAGSARGNEGNTSNDDAEP